MRLLIILFALSLQAQTIAVKHRQVMAAPPPAGITLVGQAKAFSNNAHFIPMVLNTTSGSASSGGGTTWDVALHDAAWVVLSVSDASSCNSSPPTITVSDNNSGAFSLVGSRVHNSFWGNCLWQYLASDLAAKAGYQITIDTGTDFTYTSAVAVLVRGIANAQSLTGQNSGVSGENASTVTSGSLGNGSTGDIILAAANTYRGNSNTLAVGSCANSANCTLGVVVHPGSPATDLLGVEYQILTGSQTAAAATMNNSTGGIAIVALRLHP